MSTNPYSLYPTESSGKELNMREEIRRLLFGATDEVAKGRTGLLRKMRLDSNGEMTECTCRSTITGEPDKDYYCRFCLGHGYFWDETKIVYYRNDDSFRKEKSMNPNYRGQEFESDSFYLQYDERITPNDFIVTVKRDVDGDIIVPVEREEIFKIWSADPFRADNGRIEFWKVDAERERKWSVWYGLKTR